MTTLLDVTRYSELLHSKHSPLNSHLRFMEKTVLMSSNIDPDNEHHKSKLSHELIG